MLIWLLYCIVKIYDLWLFLFTISVTAVAQDVNWKRPKDGNSALHLSAEMGHIEADSVFWGWDFTCKKWWWKHQTTVMNAAHRCWLTQHMVIYPPVIKHGNWKSTINGAFNGKINRNFSDFPLPRLMTPESIHWGFYQQTWWFTS